jgi:chromosome segregation protein
LTSTNFLL